MTTKSSHWLIALAIFLALNSQLSTAHAQGTAFTYQGRLNSGTNVATGSYDLRFALFDAVTAGTQQGNLVTNSATAVSNGLFTVTLDFGNQFPGAPRWLEIAVRTNGVTTFTNLAPRQQLTPTPYAVFAESANAGGLLGTISGNGSGLTNLNAAKITGTIASNNLPANVALLNANQTFTGTNIFNRNLILSGPGGSGWSVYDSTSGFDLWDFVANPTGFNISIAGADPSIFVNANNGNVGLSTTSPQTALQIGDLSDTGYQATIRLASAGAAMSRAWDIGVPQTGADVSGVGYSFTINDVQNGTIPEFMIKYGSGNVGVGTTTPKHKLDVNGNIFLGTAQNGQDFTELGDTLYLGASRKYLSSTLGAPVAGSTDWINLMCHPLSMGIMFGTAGPSDADPHSAPNPLMVIQSGGNVGIGTVSPGAKLTVNGAGYGIEQTDGNVLLSTYIDSSGGWLGTVNNYPLNFYVNNGFQSMTVNTNGNVGIGTATPNSDSLLQVQGMVRMGSETGTTEAPNRSILVRRVNSTSSATGQVVARGLTVGGNTMTLERDGSNGGLIIKLTGSNSNLGGAQISGYGITAGGAFVGVNKIGLANNSSTQIFTDSQKICNCRLSFGEPLNDSDMTTVELMRLVDTGIQNDNFWAGTVTSTVNQ